jgi:NADH-quinone oxidoreductase subunit J
VTTAFFYIAGAAAVGSAVAMILQRNAFLAALTLILHLASLAVLYLVLQADFLAAAQVLVYAGAVMVMFLFVIAYLGDRADLSFNRGGWGGAVAAVAGAAIFLEIVIAVTASGSGLAAGATVEDTFGTPGALADVFLTDYLLAFEVVSLLLLVGAVAGVVLGAARLRPGDEDPLGRQAAFSEQQAPEREPEPERDIVGAAP